MLEGYIKVLKTAVLLDLLGEGPGSHSLGCPRDPELTTGLF